MASEIGASVLDLQQAIRDVRISQAERDDVIVELRESERIRLVLLAEALESVFDDLPDEIDEFALAVLQIQDAGALFVGHGNTLCVHVAGSAGQRHRYQRHNG